MSEWRDETPTTPEELVNLAAEARAAFPGMDLEHDPEWIHASCDGSTRKLLVLCLRDNGRLVGLAPFFIHPTNLRFGLGELEFAGRTVQRYALEAGPLLDTGTSPDAAAKCLHHLADVMPSGAVVFLRGLPQASTLGRSLLDPGGEIRTRYYVVPHGPRYLRCRIRWTGDFDTYLRTLGKASRKDLRRTLARPDKLAIPLQLRRYADESSVDEFLHLARGVSDRTYQARLLGLGPSADSLLPGKLKRAARRSRFLGHVLFMEDRPIAFHYGLIHGRCFYMVDGGYDPDQSGLRAGILTFLKVLQDIEHHQDPVDTLDYLYGDEAYKIRTSNRHDPEQHYYLVRKDLAGAFLALAMTGTDRLSRAIGALLAKLRIKDAVKRLIRRRTG